MSSENASTAILVFTRTAREEARQKLFVESENSAVNLSISTHFISRTIREVRKSVIPYFIISSDRQHGDSFGERLMNAFGEIYESGFENVICVGNDSPQLSATLLKHAAASLKTNGLVLGPDKRGGVYLIGISKKNFDADSFKQLRWNTTHLFSDFITWNENSSCEMEVLNELADINSAADFKNLLRNKSFEFSLLLKLQSFIASLQNLISEHTTQFHLSGETLTLSRRGPPPS